MSGRASTNCWQTRQPYRFRKLEVAKDFTTWNEIPTSGQQFWWRSRPWTRTFRLPSYDWTHHKLRNGPSGWAISAVGELESAVSLPWWVISTPCVAAASVSAWVSAWMGEWRALLGVWSGRFNRKDPHFLFLLPLECSVKVKQFVNNRLWKYRPDWLRWKWFKFTDSTSNLTRLSRAPVYSFYLCWLF